MTLGNLISKEITRQGWNKTELANQLGMSRNGLYNVLTRKSIDTELLFRIINCIR